ncbi:uncharacterized protein LOC135223764 [Macrobrachium nipponense]|uniref:uncharacterized protein LOC135223764 n=1 Tax=Macrobrachium nipponense TaxID=159736 RepID=UPI0030C81EAC
MKRNTWMAMYVCLVLLVIGCEAASPLNSGTLQFLQHLGLNTGGIIPDITLGEKIRQDDSPIYYIKLPPVPYYYVNNNNLFPQSDDTTPYPFEKIAIDFTSNGRPDQIYHWNKPSTSSDVWSPWKTSSTQVPTTTTTTTTTTTPAPTTTTTPKPVKKPWLTLDKYFPYNGRPSGIYIYKPRPSINPNKFKNRYFTHFNY